MMNTPFLLNDATIPLQHHSVKTSVFEGPLDLLLFLIKKNEVDIYNIPIDTITKQYLDYLYESKITDLELTGEFFVMAATLMLIKSRMLLPKTHILEEEVESELDLDPRWELVQQLLQYKNLKEESQKLQHLIDNKHDVLPRDGDAAQFESTTPRPLKHSDRLEIWNAFNNILQKLSKRLNPAEIHEDAISVSDRMQAILARTKYDHNFTFSSLLGETPSILLIATTFLAILELARLKILSIHQIENFSDIECVVV